MSAPRDEEGSTSASLHYGILVNFHTLVRAATAFASFSSEADTLDLILSRRQRGLPIHSTIAPTPSISFHSLPVEVILLVREELRELHLAKTPNAFLEKHRGYFDHWDDDEDSEGYECPCGEDECWGEEGTRRYEQSRIAYEKYERKLEERADPAKWDEARWELHDEGNCHICFEASYRWRNLFKPDARIHVRIRRLLHSYNLSMVPSIINSRLYEARDQIVAISLPSHVRPSSSATGASAPSTSAHSHFPSLSREDDPSPEHQRATFYDPSFFAVTPEDDKKFKRIVRNFELEVADRKSGGGAFVSSLPLPTAKNWGDSAGEMKDESLREKTGEAAVKTKVVVEPAFMLLHSSIPWAS
ncbi:hypothetical protein P7C70_g3539, partial [Phenoliferia sp. Uapishka_3]